MHLSTEMEDEATTQYDDELDDEIGQLKDRMLLNQMPVIGDLRSSKMMDIK